VHHGFSFWYKKTVMPKKKVFAPRNLKIDILGYRHSALAFFYSDSEINTIFYICGMTVEFYLLFKSLSL
jgi:hypothetical protein